MKEQDKKSFVALLTQASLVFADTRTIGPDLVKVYWDVLYPYNLTDISEAFDALYHTKTFRGLPLPAEIRNAVHVTPPEPEKPAPLTWADLEGTSAAARFTRYLIVSGKWREIGEDPTGGIWRNKFEQWKTTGQPMPPKGATILKGMEA